jgi:hypothetical protein
MVRLETDGNSGHLHEIPQIIVHQTLGIKDHQGPILSLYRFSPHLKTMRYLHEGLVIRKLEGHFEKSPLL